MAERVRRIDVAQMVRDWKGGNFDQLTRRDGTGFFQKLQKAFVYNNTGAVLEVGSPVYISGAMNELAYDELVNEYLTSGFCLTGETYSADYPDRPVAFALEPIEAGSVGECRIPGLVAANIDDYSSGKPYASISETTGRLKASESEGPFVILGTSNQGENGHFSYLVPHSMSSHKCWFQNVGGLKIGGAEFGPLRAGEFVCVTGMMDDYLDCEEAVENYAREGFRLKVKRIGVIDDAYEGTLLGRGVALEDIAPGEVGKGIVWDCMMALVWCDPNIMEYSSFLERADYTTVSRTGSNGVTTDTRRLSFVKYPGDFCCIGASRKNEQNEAFALIQHAPPGPSLERIVSVDLNSNTAEMACGVTVGCIFRQLTQDDVGKSALLYRDSITKRFLIIPQFTDTQ